MAASYDIVIVGGGGAGLRAAIAVAETDPRLSVAVVSKVYPMRSHTVSAEGGAAAVDGADDTFDEHAYDTVSGSDWLCDQDAVEVFVPEARDELLRLEHWGCPWSRLPDGHIAVRAFGGMKKKRTWFAADKTGFHLLHTLFQTTPKPKLRSMELGPRDRLSQPSCTNWTRAARSTPRTARSSTWTCGTWAWTSSTPNCPSCGNSACSTSTSTRSRNSSRCGR